MQPSQGHWPVHSNIGIFGLLGIYYVPCNYLIQIIKKCVTKGKYSLGVGTSSSGPETSKGLMITPRLGDTEVRLYHVLACVGNAKMISGKC